MAVLKVVTENEHNPVLRNRASEVTAKELASPAIQQLIVDMVETMYASRGVGIAAPQVGVGKRIFIAESSRGPMAFVNPVLSDFSRKLLKDEEGCLSVPGLYDKVMRSKTVTVAALAPNGQPFTFKAENFFARIIQHENDHLDGVLFIDRVQEQRPVVGK
jgi:peptide deformylase